MLLQSFMGEKFGRDPIWEGHFATEVAQAEISVDAVLYEADIPLKQLMMLKVGDFMPYVRVWNYEGGKKHGLQFVAINDLGDAKTNAHLLRFDSVHGPFPGEVKTTKNGIPSRRAIAIGAAAYPFLAWDLSGDLGLRNGIRIALGLEAPPSPDEAVAIEGRVGDDQRAQPMDPAVDGILETRPLELLEERSRTGDRPVDRLAGDHGPGQARGAIDLHEARRVDRVVRCPGRESCTQRRAHHHRDRRQGDHPHAVPQRHHGQGDTTVGNEVENDGKTSRQARSGIEPAAQEVRGEPRHLEPDHGPARDQRRPQRRLPLHQRPAGPLGQRERPWAGRGPRQPRRHRVGGPYDDE